MMRKQGGLTSVLHAAHVLGPDSGVFGEALELVDSLARREDIDDASQAVVRSLVTVASLPMLVLTLFRRGASVP